MIEISFAEDLYDGRAVDAAVKTFQSFASFELERGDGRFRIRLTSTSDFPEERIADELANFALGLTIESAHAGDAAADEGTEATEGTEGAG